MKKKYIIDLNPDCVEGEYLRIPARIAGEEQWLVTKAALTPYTEPDLEQVRKEAYEEGKKQAKVQAELDVCHDIEKVAKGNYKAGLSDAWEAARKICSSDRMTSDMRKAIFGWSLSEIVMDKVTASEAIEKLKAYEQEQGAEIKVGDEVELKCGVRPAIYMQGSKRFDEIYLLFNDGSCGVHSKSEIERKTGRHFPEIATILEKMRGEQDG